MDNKYYPNIIVKLAVPEYNAKEVTNTLYMGLHGTNTSLPFTERIYKVFPELKDSIKYDMSKNEVYENVFELVKKKFEYEKEEMESKVKQSQNIVNMKIVPAVRAMIDDFEVNWPLGHEIICYLGLFNPFPRDVMKKEYCLHYMVNTDVLLRASMHEINHFVLFEKWKSMHGYNKDKEPSYPDALWFLEEMTVAPILNSKRMQSIAPYPQSGYIKFYDNEIDGISIEQNIQIIFDESSTMDGFLNKAYEFICIHLDEIIQKCG